MSSRTDDGSPEPRHAAGSSPRTPGAVGAAGEDDPLAGATIVVHDLSQSHASPFTRTSTPAAPSAAAPDRWFHLRLAAMGTAGVAAGIAVGVIGYVAWVGRPPVPITMGILGAAPKIEIRVHVEGAVTQPGVYKLAQGDRVEDAIKAAGGLASHADSGKLNLAQRVRDEQRLDVPALSAARPPSAETSGVAGASADGASPIVAQAVSSGSNPAAPTTSAARATTIPRPTSTPRPQATTRPTSSPRAEPTARATAFSGGKVNVNTATQAQLEQLPGIGATSAQRIIAYRAGNGPLRSLDDLRNAGVQDQFVRQAADYLLFE